MSTNYTSYPKVTINWQPTNIYVIINYYGNAIVGTGSSSSPLTSGKQTGTSWNSGDLSFNALYTFIVTPYNAAGFAGKIKTIVVDTSFKVSGTSYNSTSQIKWYGNYYYTKIYRKISSPYSTDYVDICSTYLTTNSYYDNDLSGNTTYTYYIQPYDVSYNKYSTSNELTVKTSILPARDLSTIFYDSSAIQISFKLPKNSYVSSYYYMLRANSYGINKDVSGLISPLIVRDLSSGTTYSLYVYTYLDGVLESISSTLSITTKYIIIPPIVPSNTIVYYLFYNDINNNKLINYTNNSYDLLLNNISLTTTYFKYGYSALYSTGGSQYALNSSLSVVLSGGVTIAFWLLQMQYNDGGIICSLYNNNSSISITTNKVRNVYAYLLFASNNSNNFGNYYLWCNVGNYYQNIWTHWCFTLTTNSSIIYVNGVQKVNYTDGNLWGGGIYDPDSYLRNFVPNFTATNLGIFCMATNTTSSCVNNVIDSFKIYNRVLSAEEVNTLYNTSD